MNEIKEILCEDHLKDIYFFHTGKKNIFGLHHPDSSISNDKNYKYIRIGKIEYDLPDASSEVCIHENLTVSVENGTSTSELYKNTIVNDVTIFGIVKANRVVSSSFKCLCTPIMDSLSILDIRLTEEKEVIDEVDVYSLGIWLNVENITKVFISLNISHSTNTVPLNDFSFSSGYTIKILKESEKLIDINTSSLSSFIDSMKFCNSANSNQDLIDRVIALENKPSSEICFGSVLYDIGFEPMTTGSEALAKQTVTPTSIDTGLGQSPFLSMNTADQYVSVYKDGIYAIQLCSKFIHAISEEKINISVIVNEDEIISLNYNPHSVYEMGDFINSSMVVVNLKRDDLIKLKFQFVGTPEVDIVNDGTNIKVIRLQ